MAAGRKRIVYLGPDDKLMSVSVKVNGNEFEAGSPNPLFEVRVSFRGPNTTAYSVTRDGQRFLMNLRSDESPSSPFVVVQNWTASLKNSVV
jgi:hypothetical protein